MELSDRPCMQGPTIAAEQKDGWKREGAPTYYKPGDESPDRF
jgi:hypothetical protein